MKKVIILGGTGFIGSHVVEQFHLAGYAVSLVVRKNSDCTEIEHFCNDIIRVDFEQEEDLVKAFENHDLLVNCIAYVNTHNTLEALNKIQVSLNKKITLAAIDANIQRYFLLSTVEAYGFEGNPIKTESSPYIPTHNFQQSFIDKEKMFLETVKNTSMEYVILQPASCIGKREKSTSFFLPIYEMHKQGLNILGSKGKAKVSLVDTRDIGRAFVFFAENPDIKNEIFLQKGYTTTWYELKKMIDLYTKKISKELNLPVALLKPLSKLSALITPKGKEPAIPPLAVDLFSKDVMIDDTKLAQTGFEPKYTLADSVKDAIDYFENTQEDSENDLFEWMSKGRYFQYEGNQIYFRHTPNQQEKCIVFLHGFPSSSFDYKYIWDRLDGRYSLLAFDFLGLGFSDKPNRKSSVFEQVEILKELLKQLDITSIHIIAHNYGTIVGQEILAQYKEGLIPVQIDKLILLNGSVFPELYKPTSFQKLLTSPFGGFLNQWFGNIKSLFAKNLAAVFGKETPPTKQQVDDFWQLYRYHNGNLKAYQFLNYINERKVHAQRWTDAMEKTAVKTKMINGIDDPVSGLDIINAYLERISPDTGVKLANIGHYPQIESPERVLKEIISFVT